MKAITLNQNAWRNIPANGSLVTVVRAGVYLDDKWVIGGIAAPVVSVITEWKQVVILCLGCLTLIKNASGTH